MLPASAPSPSGAWRTPCWARRWGENVQWGMKAWSGNRRRGDLPMYKPRCQDSNSTLYMWGMWPELCGSLSQTELQFIWGGGGYRIFWTIGHIPRGCVTNWIWSFVMQPCYLHVKKDMTEIDPQPLHCNGRGFIFYPKSKPEHLTYLKLNKLPLVIIIYVTHIITTVLPSYLSSLTEFLGEPVKNIRIFLTNSCLIFKFQNFFAPNWQHHTMWDKVCLDVKKIKKIKKIDKSFSTWRSELKGYHFANVLRFQLTINEHRSR